jgi:general stress protein 26
MKPLFKSQTDWSLPIIRQKINELQSALFFSTGNALLKIPSHVVKAAEADEEGRIWFAVPKPNQSLAEFDKEFPAKLDFFRKGKRFFLKIEGKACIMREPEEMRSAGSIMKRLRQKLANQELLLIHLDIKQVDYFEARPESAPEQPRRTMAQLYQWLMPVRRRPARLEPAPIPVYQVRDKSKNQGMRL